MEKRLSNIVKPDGMTAEEWQRELRKESAARELLSIVPSEEETGHGVFFVRNPKSRNSYKVVYRGDGSRWNFCSCMDFKTSRLGTCKHIEAVKRWVSSMKMEVKCCEPEYSSMYLSYRGERTVCLRIGTICHAEISSLSKSFFDAEGRLIPESMHRIYEFISKARALDPDFRCYPDVMDFIAECQDRHYREQFLRNLDDNDLDSLLHTTLYPFQKEGIRFAFRTGKSIIADEMGLGKTVQAIGTAELMRKAGLITSVIVLCPASLKYQWKKEIERFSGASSVIVEGTQAKRTELYGSDAVYRIVSYNAAGNDIRLLGKLHTECIIMDEIQRLKNWNTLISRTVRRIRADYAIVLSGTPLENNLDELYSVMEFVDPYCLGPYYKFVGETTVRDVDGKVVSYKNLNAVGDRLKKRLIRRTRRQVALQLPERTDKNLFVPLTVRQKELHDEYRAAVVQLVAKWRRSNFMSDQERRRMLMLLNQMRMVCDSTWLIDQQTRNDTKVGETVSILRNMIGSGDGKVVIFSQWERMTRIVAGELDNIGVKYSSLNGKVPSEKRSALIDSFWNDPDCRVFLSTDTGSSGLNLQNASLVINLDLPWNPAVMEQRISRIYRIGQNRCVQIINMISKDSFEEKMLSVLDSKSSLFEGVLDGGDDAVTLDGGRMDKVMAMVDGFVSGDSAENGTDSGRTFKSATCFRSEQPGMSHATLIDMESSADVNGRKPSDADELVKKVISLANGLSAVMDSPEASKLMVDRLLYSDPSTGREELRIPVRNRASAHAILAALADVLTSVTGKMMT